MELPTKLLEQISFNTRPKIEKHMIIVVDKSSHEEHLAQPLHINNKQIKIAVTLPTAYIGIFNVKNSNITFYLIKSITDKDGYIQVTIPPGAYGIESLNNEIKRINIEEEHYTAVDYPSLFKPNFSTLGSIIEISNPGSVIEFVPDDSIRDLLAFYKTTI